MVMDGRFGVGRLRRFQPHSLDRLLTLSDDGSLAGAGTYHSDILPGYLAYKTLV